MTPSHHKVIHLNSKKLVILTRKLFTSTWCLIIFSRSEAKYLKDNIRKYQAKDEELKKFPDFPDKFVNFINNVRGLSAFSTYSVLDLIIGELEKDERFVQKGPGRREIINGTDVLVQTLYKQIKDNVNFTLIGGSSDVSARVYKIEHTVKINEN